MSQEQTKVELPNASDYEYIGVNICGSILVGNTKVVFATITNRKIDRLLETDQQTWSKYFKKKEGKKANK